MRKPATTADLAPGVTVFTSRTGHVARTVVAIERDLLDTSGAPLVLAKRDGSYMETAFAVRELWVEVAR